MKKTIIAITLLSFAFATHSFGKAPKETKEPKEPTAAELTQRAYGRYNSAILNCPAARDELIAAKAALNKAIANEEKEKAEKKDKKLRKKH